MVFSFVFNALPSYIKYKHFSQFWLDSQKRRKWLNTFQKSLAIPFPFIAISQREEQKITFTSASFRCVCELGKSIKATKHQPNNAKGNGFERKWWTNGGKIVDWSKTQFKFRSAKWEVNVFRMHACENVRTFYVEDECHWFVCVSAAVSVFSFICVLASIWCVLFHVLRCVCVWVCFCTVKIAIWKWFIDRCFRESRPWLILHVNEFIYRMSHESNFCQRQHQTASHIQQWKYLRQRHTFRLCVCSYSQPCEIINIEWKGAKMMQWSISIHFHILYTTWIGVISLSLSISLPHSFLHVLSVHKIQVYSHLLYPFILNNVNLTISWFEQIFLVPLSLSLIHASFILYRHQISTKWINYES